MSLHTDTVQIRSTAVHAIEADERLSASEQVRFVNLIHHDIAMAETYLALTSPTLRTSFVKEVLRPS